MIQILGKLLLCQSGARGPISGLPRSATLSAQVGNSRLGSRAKAKSILEDRSYREHYSQLADEPLVRFVIEG
jgi:hypothetical protein